MAIPKNKSLVASESTGRSEQTQSTIIKNTSSANDRIINIRPVDCLNDFVAILQSEIDTFLALPAAGDSSGGKFKNEGIVIGVGPGTSDGVGGRLKLSVEIGDYVMFGDKNIISKIEPDNGPYAGKKVVIVSERNILCKLPTDIKWQYYSE